MHYIDQIAELKPLLTGANHIDVKIVESERSLREFVAAMMGYQPGWVTFLYRVRALFVRLLGMKQEGIPRGLRLSPEEVPMTPGAKLAFFTVRSAREDQFMVAHIHDQHLDAALGVVAEPLSGNKKRFHVLTVVHYNNWAGPVYFNIIRPFHHLVVGGMARAGAVGQV